MIKNTKKAFTLVELIVVITILAILGTIAFISLQGYSQEAKTAKTGQDLRNLATAIEVAVTKGDATVSAVVTTDATITTNNGYTTGDYATGSTLASGTYTIGTVNFLAIGQNGDDFADPAHNAYIAATVGNSKYQVAGEIINDAGLYEAIVKGNYISDGETNTVASLISTVTPADDTSFVNGVTNATARLY